MAECQNVCSLPFCVAHKKLVFNTTQSTVVAVMVVTAAAANWVYTER